MNLVKSPQLSLTLYFHSQDNRISLVDYVVSYYLRNIDKVSTTDKKLLMNSG